MIISGFTQKKSFSNQQDEMYTNLPGQHSHCLHCRQVTCTHFVDNVTACVMVTCESCGWRCHDCKKTEHTLTCPEERVFCVNKEYGCPHMLKRSKMASHLPVCPASVVCCVEEWSRWPMHAKETGQRMPLPTSKTYLDCGQLDVGLAMRDQRMLIDSLRAPQKLRRILRNPLTQKYPAAPLNYRSSSFDSDMAASGNTSQTLSDDDTDAPWDLSKPHPGLRESIRNRLFLVTKETTESLASALEMTSNVLASSQNKNPVNGCDGLKQVDGTLDDENVKERSSCSPVRDDFSSDIKDSTFSRNSESAEKSVQLTADRSNRASQSAERSVRSSVSSDRCSDTSSRSKSTWHDIGGTQLHKLLGYQPEEGQEISLAKMLGVNIGFECINKYVAKPPSMYTFICSQNFRRDEFKWHFKNIHQEIHQGFCGWLEQRCPLAYLGCTFSFQRMEPSQPNRMLYHSPLLESYGLRSTVQPYRSPSSFNTSIIPASENIQQPSTLENMPDFENKSGQKNSVENCQKEYMNCEIDTDNSKNPSISSLAAFDKEFDILTVGKLQLDPKPSNEIKQAGTSHPHSSECDMSSSKKYCMRVQPTIYTAYNWDSKVLFQYDIEEDYDDDGCTSLSNLPFEVLQQIARHLDSFSLCNLALTSRLLREVCCSLLNEHGIVLLNWQKHKEENSGVTSWKVVNKRWLFSTSFEPVESWKYTENHPTIGDHLKICPFNKDITRHTQPFKVFLDSPDRTFHIRPQ